MFASVLIGLLALLAAARHLRRRAERGAAGERLTDDLIRRIEHEGRLHLEEEEPLDQRRIDEEEARFWEDERWDEADPL